MIATGKLINISISSHGNHLFVCVMTAPETYSLSKFPVYNTVLLTIVTMHISSLELIHPMHLQLCTLQQASTHFPLIAAPGNHCATLCFHELTFLDSTYK